MLSSITALLSNRQQCGAMVALTQLANKAAFGVDLMTIAWS
ncbi:hypothetical protein JCM19237_6839 [Photobacterium aphoticum]|uniref:Uncharacterized protein n=1 Tax=Photobacterium aphoticum TaxID=754436 RepID=A0A090RKR5_9GAMM|nr:hypothetical protein JCM19237_6839 [Photobacterium aphoticum]